MFDLSIKIQTNQLILDEIFLSMDLGYIASGDILDVYLFNDAWLMKFSSLFNWKF